MSNKPTNGKTNPGTPAGSGAAGSSSIVQGLQSVMAVIGENYEAPVEAAKEAAAPAAGQAANVLNAAAAASTGSLSNKIAGIGAVPAAATETSSVTKGLQSIMAVIGEEYEEEGGGGTVAATPAAVTAAPSPLALPVDEDNPDARDALSDLMPLLTEEEKGTARSDTRVMGTSVAVVGAAAVGGSKVSSLLDQLKGDIVELERENIVQRQKYNMPVAAAGAPDEVRDLLTQLQGDISSLRSENDALKTRYNIPVAGEGSEVATLLAQLQGDITSLRSENDALKNKYGISTDGGQVSGLLAQLQGDIANLRQENDAFKSYYNVPAARSRGTSFGQALLMSLGLLALIGGATIGGFYFANRMNDQKNGDLLAMLGLQKQQSAREAAVRVAPPAAVPAAAPVQLAKKEKIKVAAVAPPAPPALPKITVKRPQLDSAEVKALIDDAQNLIELGDLVSARQMLEYAMSQKSATAAYKLAQTYDPLHLATMASVLSVEPNLTRAKVLYYSAARQGHQAAAKRLAELRRTPGN